MIYVLFPLVALLGVTLGAIAAYEPRQVVVKHVTGSKLPSAAPSAPAPKPKCCPTSKPDSRRVPATERRQEWEL